MTARSLLLLTSLVALAAGCSDALAQGIPGDIECPSIGGDCSAIATHRAPSTGCPALPAVPDIHYAARLETTYDDNDPACTLTDFGSSSNDATQGTSAACSTFKSPCEAGKLNGLPCFDADGGDSHDTSTFAAQAQPGTVCAVIRDDEPTGSSIYISSGVNTSNRHSFSHDWDGSSPNQGELFIYSGGTEPMYSPTLGLAGRYDVDCLTYDGVSSEIDQNGTVIADGSDVGTDATIGFGIMYYRPAGTHRLDGAIAEWMYFDTPPDIEAVKATLSCLYGSTPQ